jgi:hypothetical protein
MEGETRCAPGEMANVLRRRGVGGGGRKPHQKNKIGNNPYGASGTQKCYNCRMKKSRVSTSLSDLSSSAPIMIPSRPASNASPLECSIADGNS